MYIYVEDSQTIDIAAAKSKIRITASSQRFKGFRELDPLSMKRLSPSTRLEILKGNIRWIFVLDHPKDLENAGVEEKKVELFRGPTPSPTQTSWESEKSTSTNKSTSTESSSGIRSGRTTHLAPLQEMDRL